MTPATDLHPDYAAGLLQAVSDAAAAARLSKVDAEADRDSRDHAIRHAHAQGLGIREIGRATGIDPTHVSRIVKRAS